MEKQIEELMKGLTALHKQATEIGKDEHHAKAGLIAGARGRIGGAIEMVESHQRWLEKNPAPKAATPTSAKA